MSFEKIFSAFIFTLITCYSFAQIEFADPVVLMANDYNTRLVFSSDLDGDGDNDVICGNGYLEDIVWYKNTDGLGSFGRPITITTSLSNPVSIIACDLDGDGDNDIVAASESEDKVVWYENLDGTGTFGTAGIIVQYNQPVCAIACDLDGDGDNDIITSSTYYNDIIWYENNGTGTFGTGIYILNSTFGGIADIYAGDLDGDGDKDVFSVSKSDDKIAWFQNDGSGNFGSQIVISTSGDIPISGFICDIDGDNDNDLVSMSYMDHKIAWYENLDGLGNFGSEQVITTLVYGAESIYANDIDNDGDIDIASVSVSTSMYGNRIAWYENTDGQGTFSAQNIISDSKAYSVFICELNGNNKNDILIPFYDEHFVGFFTNVDSIGADSLYRISRFIDFPDHISTADLDVDGDSDLVVLSTNDSTIVWFENLDGNGNFSSARPINAFVPKPTGLSIDDVDLDGDPDIITAFYGDGEVVYYPNDGFGNFATSQLISNNVIWPKSVYSADINNDGVKDILSASYADDKIAWYENQGGGTFGTQQLISSLVNGAGCVISDDLDNDGDLDVIATSESDDKIVWFENNGTGSFSGSATITTQVDLPKNVFSCDIDGDGDKDLLSASYYDKKIALYKNNGTGVFGTQTTIGNTQGAYALDVIAIDIDLDDDNDIISGKGEISYCENINGTGNFGAPVNILPVVAGSIVSVESGDIDGDGDYDLAYTTKTNNKVLWLRNITKPIITGQVRDTAICTNQDIGFSIIAELYDTCIWTIDTGNGYEYLAPNGAFELIGQDSVLIHSGNAGFGNCNFYCVLYNGADSTVSDTATLLLYPEYEYIQYDTLCDLDSIWWQGVFLNSTGIYDTTFASIYACDSTYQMHLTVYPTPSSFTISGQDTVSLNQTEIYFVPYDLGVNYNWSITNGFIVTDISDNVKEVQWNSMGIGEITVFSENQYGCVSNIAALDVLIGSVEVFNSNTSGKIFMYPNPVTDVINIGGENNNFVYELKNVYGKILVSTGNRKIDMSYLPPGVYFLIVRNNKGLILEKQKIIKI